MGAVDNFPGQGAGVSAPSDRFLVITPDDDNDLAEIPKFLYIGASAGTVVCRDKSGNQATFHGAAGQKLEIRPVRILESSTATTIIGCY